MVEPARSPLLAACLAASLLGCGAGAELAPPPAAAASLRIADGDFDRDPRAVSGHEAALDLDVAVRAFEEAYAGVDGAPRLPPVERIAATRARLDAEPRWTPEALVEVLAELLRQPDGHLAFGWDGRSPLRREVWPRASPGPRARPPSPAVALVPGPVPRLVVRTFDSAAAADLARLPGFARELWELPAFVVDLRGNGGGNFGYATSFLLELTSAPLRLLDEREVVSVAAAEGRANSARRHVALGEVPATARPVFRAHVEALDAEAALLKQRGVRRSERVAEGSVLGGRARGPLRGRAVFLVDGGCASACEMTVALARQIPGVVIAGERTRGSMAAGEIALFRLPRSGVTISLGTRAFHDPLGGFAETRGFLPDVPLTGPDVAARAGALAERGMRGLAVFDGSQELASAKRSSRRGFPPTVDEEHDSGGPSRVVSPAPTRVSSRR